MDQKSVLITGCSDGGIGHYLAMEFASRGLFVFATTRNTSKISKSLSSLSNVAVLSLDVTSAASIAAAVKAVSERTGGKLDYLVNNAGSGYTVPLLDANLEIGRGMFDVNFWGLIACTQGFMPLLIESKGTVANCSSIAGVVANPWESMYGATKAAVNVVSDTLRLEVKPFGVKVVTVMLGAVRTTWFGNLPDSKLPQNSLYKDVQEFLLWRAGGGESRREAMDGKTFAKRAVGDILGGANGRIWRGALSTKVRLGLAILPYWIQDWVMSDRGQVYKVSSSGKTA